jgi:hypothetical protein
VEIVESEAEARAEAEGCRRRGKVSTEKEKGGEGVKRDGGEWRKTVKTHLDILLFIRRIVEDHDFDPLDGLLHGEKGRL